MLASGEGAASSRSDLASGSEALLLALGELLVVLVSGGVDAFLVLCEDPRGLWCRCFGRGDSGSLSFSLSFSFALRGMTVLVV